ncbi:MAG: ferritin family protein [Dehalococcoidia bacterium]
MADEGLSRADAEVIELLAQHEEAISKLYRTYSRKLPQLDAFWSALAQEETSHAAWMRKLGLKVGQEGLFVNKGRFKAIPVRASIDFISEEIAHAEAGIKLQEALSKALLIEQGMIERKYFEIFESDSVELKNVLRNLAEDTKRHISRIKGEKEKHN